MYFIHFLVFFNLTEKISCSKKRLLHKFHQFLFWLAICLNTDKASGEVLIIGCFHGVTGLAQAQLLYPKVGSLSKFCHYNKLFIYTGLRMKNKLLFYPSLVAEESD